MSSVRINVSLPEETFKELSRISGPEGEAGSLRGR